MQGRNFLVFADLAASDIVMRRTFWIGVYPGLGESQINFMICSDPASLATVGLGEVSRRDRQSAIPACDPPLDRRRPC